MTGPSHRDLASLARAAGVQTQYKDNEGRVRRASPDALLAVLKALGHDLSSAADAAHALDEHERRARTSLVDPVVVAWNGQRRSPITVDAPTRHVVRAQLHLADGSVRPVRTTGPGSSGRHELAIDGGPLPAGYHRLEVECGPAHSEAVVVAAPTRAHQLQEARRGVVAPVPSLHSTSRAVAGTFRDLSDLGRWVARHGGDLVGTLPLLPRVEGDPSPYAPSSRRFWDEALIDPESVPTIEAATAAHGRDRLTGERSELIDVELRSTEHRRMCRVLHQALASQPALLREVDEALSLDPLLRAYAEFRAGSRDRDDARHQALLQHLAAGQMTELRETLAHDGIALYLDLPVGVHPDGFDCSDRADLFVRGVSVGAPPDALFAGGQSWGFPPLAPEASRAEAHAYFRECLEHHMEAADLLRIDHVMGLHRQFWVPDGMPPSEGVYVLQPHQELWAMVCLESQRHRCAVVGENLGTVPAAVNQELRRHRVSGLWVFPFELGDGRPASVDAGDVAVLGTHDTPTFAGFLAGRDIEDRVDLGFTSDDEAEKEMEDRRRILQRVARSLGSASAEASDLLDAALGWLRDEPATATVVPLEDLWLEPEQQNVPGTTGDLRPNWRRRMRHPVDRLDDVPEVSSRLERLTTGRTPLRGGPQMPAPSPDKPTTAAERPRSAAAGNDTDPVTGITPDDLYWFNEGTHRRLYEKLGAHPKMIDGTQGTSFAVWAPNAEAVSVKGEFNGWDDDQHQLDPLAGSGIWRGFVAGVGPGELYKLHIRSRHDGYRVDKADPFAFATEMPPATASRIADLSYEWGDHKWMAERASHNAIDGPMSVYEVHLGSWKRVPEEGNRSIHYTEAASSLADYLSDLGFTHVELVPIMEHPFFGSWGYQTTSYFAPSARYGSPTELMALVDALHQRGIGVIIDWVPSHFPTDEHGLAYFDGTHLFEHDDPKQGYHPDWNSYIFNYGRHEVRSFLTSSALFWLDRYHIDGIRVDAVASMLYLDYSRAEGEWIPNRFGGRENLEAIDFLRTLNEAVYDAHPDVQTIAEESTAWPMVSRPTYVGGLGFGLKWDMGWMHDTLEYFSRDPVHRRHHHHELTFRMVYAFNENFVLPLSHDEVVHGKGSLLGRMPGNEWERFANLRALYGYMYSQPGKKLLFMGAELAMPGEWDHDGSLDWHLQEEPLHAGVRRWLAHLNHLHRAEAALHEHDTSHHGFEWVEANDAANSVLAWLRLGREGAPVLVVANLTPVHRTPYRLGVPEKGDWLEIANSDAEEYGGSGAGNLGRVSTTPFPSHGHDQSLVLTLPPLSVLMLKPDRP